MSEMPIYVTINGVQVDVADPCELYRALVGYRIKLATGGQVEEIEVRSPLTTRRTRFSAGSKLADIDKMIEEAKAACDADNGACAPRRTRYAISGRMRPY